ncbi:hypothetical protein GOODEAATRI_022261 [Goodea atripinnis]|uniref:Uncharacterized protein n=1 Tax=Goodea atripinnis TaxID=208336 RepID=A0ABV0P6Y7_9TELE
MLGRHYFTSWASCLQYDHETQHAFVGDYSGQITLLKLEKQTYSIITTLKGHEGKNTGFSGGNSLGTKTSTPVHLDLAAVLFSCSSSCSVTISALQFGMLSLVLHLPCCPCIATGSTGSIGVLWWDPAQRLLFSGASDHSIIMWDIGGRKGRTLLLQGHQ